MAKRKLCNYANASNETTRAEAIYQRGQFYIVQNNNRLKDRRRYGVYLNDSLIGLGGSLVRLKRFVNDMYTAFPFAVDVDDSMTDKVRKLGKRAQLQLRPSMQPSKAEPKPAAKRTRRKKNQASKPKSTPAAKSKPAAKSTPAASGKITAAQWKEYKQKSAKARSILDGATLIRINGELAGRISQKPQAISKLLKENQDTIDFINLQQRLF